MGYAETDMMSLPYWPDLQRRTDLVDLAPLGEAEQSSLSDFSKPRDAQRAVEAVRAAYAFHTRREVDPWWRLDLRDVYPAAYIVVHNRLGYEARAASLVVEISLDGIDWHVLQRAPGPFGSAQRNGPLIVPVPEGMNVRFLRLSLEGKEIFHLSRVQVLAPRRPGVCIAHRIDGLWARLLVMLNTMVFAQAHGADFKFTWPTRPAHTTLHHATEAVDTTFGAGFIAEHYLAELPDDCIRPQRDDMKSGRLKAFLGTGRSVLMAVKNAKLQIRRADNGFVKAFNRIQFSPGLEAVRDRVNAISLPPHPVAVHMRAGDIIYGRYRFSNEFTGKVISYPVARKLLVDLIAEGKTPVLFSQDVATGHRLAAEFGIPLGADLVEKLAESELEIALAELFLMTRCERIYAGDSNFPIIAAVAGGVDIIDPATQLGGEAQAIVIRDGMDQMIAADIAPLQIAFACWSGVYYSDNSMGIDRIALIDKAIAYDPENDFYRLMKAGLYFERGEREAADTVLQDLYDRYADSDSFTDSGMQRFLRRFFTGANPWTGPIVKPIQMGAEAGSTLGIYFAGLFHLIRKDRRGARTWFQRLPKDGPPLKYS